MHSGPGTSRGSHREVAAQGPRWPRRAGSLPAVLQGAVGLDLELVGAEQLGEGAAEAVVAQWVEDGVDCRVGPQEPEGRLVPVVGDAVAVACSPDDH